MSKKKTHVTNATLEPRAVIYVRVSTDEQVDKYGLDVQLEQCHTYAKLYNLPICNVYEDKGISGTKDTSKRPALSMLLDAAKRGEFTHLIVSSLDRLARKLSLTLEIWNKLEAAGIKIVVIKEKIDTSTAVGTLMRNLIASIADFERDVIRDRVTAGRNKRIEKDGERGGTLPLGYKRSEGVDGAIEIDLIGANLVRHVFALRNEGKTYAAIADTLNNEGHRTQRGKQWHGSSVREIIINEAKYRGGARGSKTHKAESATWPTLLENEGQANGN